MSRLKRVVLLIQANGAFGRGLLAGIARYANTHGPWSFFHQTEERKRSPRYLRNWPPDGVIVDAREMGGFTTLIPEDVPRVVVNASVEAVKLSCVESDHLAIGHMAAEHLLERGFRHFAYCSYTDMDWSRRRGEVFEQHLAGAGFETYHFGKPYTRTRLSWEQELQLLAQWLAPLPKPLALMACNDDRGRHVLEACKEVGLHVPEEVAVLGVDNDEIVCNLTHPPLSSIALNTIKGGYDTAEVLDRLMGGKVGYPHRVLISPTHVVDRQSTDIHAIDDPEVAAAVRYIRDHSKEPIQVASVTQELAISRRVLERRFRRILHRSIHDEIRRVRIMSLEKALVDTRLSVTDIAYKWGFPGPEEFARFFRSAKGISPSRYRRENCAW